MLSVSNNHKRNDLCVEIVRDLADFMKAANLTDPQIHKTLIGFSSGGGFVLREASGPNRGLFDAYLAISPYIAYDAPTRRPSTGGWTSALGCVRLVRRVCVPHHAAGPGPGDTATSAGW